MPPSAGDRRQGAFGGLLPLQSQEHLQVDRDIRSGGCVQLWQAHVRHPPASVISMNCATCLHMPICTASHPAQGDRQDRAWRDMCYLDCACRFLATAAIKPLKGGTAEDPETTRLDVLVRFVDGMRSSSGVGCTEAWSLAKPASPMRHDNTQAADNNGLGQPAHDDAVVPLLIADELPVLRSPAATSRSRPCRRLHQPPRVRALQAQAPLPKPPRRPRPAPG